MTPAFTHGKVAVFKITDSGSTSRDISNIVKTANIKRTADTAETSAMGSTAKSYLAGLTDAVLSIDGYCDVTTIGYLNGIFGAPTPFEFDPQGTASGMEKYTGTCIINDLETNSDVGTAVTVKGTMQITGAITVGSN